MTDGGFVTNGSSLSVALWRTALHGSGQYVRNPTAAYKHAAPVAM